MIFDKQALRSTSDCLPSLRTHQLPASLVAGGSSSSQVPGTTGARSVVGCPRNARVASTRGSWVLICCVTLYFPITLFS